MNNPINLDVLIVYNKSITVSASSSSLIQKTPFKSTSKNKIYNHVYAYFLKVCQDFNLNAAFTTSADIIGPGLCSCFWEYKNNSWKKVNNPCFSKLIFSKFSPTKKRAKALRQLLFSSADIKSFNDPFIFNLFLDKQKTYNLLSKFSIPTVPIIKKDAKSIKNTCKKLNYLISQHNFSDDFSTDIVMKDRFGAGGRHIYKYKTGQSKLMFDTINKNTNISYIIQPFTKFDHGFSYHDKPASTDIRLIYLNGKIIQTYIRVAKPDEFRCNEHQGGLLTYISQNDLPKSLVAKANKINKSLKNKSSLYTLDFIISNHGNPYLLEGNTGPGLDWNTSIQKNIFEGKRLIALIVKELSYRCQQSNC